MSFIVKKLINKNDRVSRLSQRNRADMLLRMQDRKIIIKKFVTRQFNNCIKC